MTKNVGIKQPDGTFCRKGANCKRHGLKATISRQILDIDKNAKKQQLNNLHKNVSSLLPKNNQVRKGLNNPSQKNELEKLHTDTETFLSSLDKNTRNALHLYKLSAFRNVNNYLIGGSKYITEFYRKNYSEEIDENDLETYVTRAQKMVPKIDEAFVSYNSMVKQREPRLLYRSFRVPPSQKGTKTTRSDINSFVKQTYKIGDVITNKSYTSTSVDSDFPLVDCQRKPEQIIVHEIVSSKGIPLFKRFTQNDKSIQNAEKEILLPRNTSFRVVNIVEAEYESSYSENEILPFNTFGDVPRSKTFTVIQMVEV